MNTQALDAVTKQPTNREVEFSDMHKEFDDYFKHDFKCRKVTKHFAFNVSGAKVPQTCDYLQVNYFSGKRNVKKIKNLKFQ